MSMYGCGCGKPGNGTREPSNTTRRYYVTVRHPKSGNRECRNVVRWDETRRGYVMELVN